MSSSKLIEETIANQQRSMETYQSQIQQEIDRDNQDAVPSLQQKVTECANQIKSLQSDLQGALAQEKKDAIDAAREEQEKEDNGGLLGF